MPVLAPGVALVDPGPSSCLDALELGLNGIGTSTSSSGSRVRLLSKPGTPERCSSHTSDPHRVGAAFEVSWLGLARYWRKKGG